jgi:formylglycine-generating enzyme required for sulfatase activity
MKLLLLIFIFSLSYFNIAAQSRGSIPVTVTIDQKPEKLYKGSYALIIGNSEYDGNVWRKLEGVKKDVNAVKKVLESHNFEVILAENLTKRGIDSVLNGFVQKYGQNYENRLLFYYAGHGATTTNNITDEKLGWLVPVETISNPGIQHNIEFEKEAYPMYSIIQYAKNRMRAKHALFIFDACFSGALFNSRSSIIPNYIREASKGPLRYFITSGDEDEYVPDKSIFCEHFINALTTSDADFIEDGYLTEEELALYLKREVNRYRTSQHPRYGALNEANLDKGDFIFVLPEEAKTIPNRNYSKKPEGILTTIGTEPVFVSIPGGAFNMGAKYGSDMSQKPYHKVKVPEFKMAKHETTNLQYCAFLNEKGNQKVNGIEWIALNSRNCQIEIKNGVFVPKEGMEDFPVVEVTWHGAKAYCKWIKGRLPTEAEWEFAARANSNFEYAGSNFISEVAWYRSNSKNSTHSVGKLQENSFKLFDMSGNVAEWVEDKWHTNYINAPANGNAWIKEGLNNYKTVRGGNFYSSVKQSMITYRIGKMAEASLKNVGFRCCK